MMAQTFLTGTDLTQLSLWAALAVGIGIAALALFFGNRPGRQSAPPVESPPSAAEPEYDPFIDGSRSEKRGAYRRRGRPVDLEISDEKGLERSWRGWVIDRSAGGLRMASEQAAEVGAVLAVRVTGLQPPMPWIKIEVRHCKPMQQGWELGCKFVRPPTWNLLLMFG